MASLASHVCRQSTLRGQHYNTCAGRAPTWDLTQLATYGAIQQVSGKCWQHTQHKDTNEYLTASSGLVGHRYMAHFLRWLLFFACNSPAFVQLPIYTVDARRPAQRTEIRYPHPHHQFRYMLAQRAAETRNQSLRMHSLCCRWRHHLPCNIR